MVAEELIWPCFQSLARFHCRLPFQARQQRVLDRLQLEPGGVCRERHEKRLEPIAVMPGALSSSRYGSRVATLDIRLIKAVL